MNDNFAKEQLLKMAERLHIKEWSKALGIKQDLIRKSWLFYKRNIIEKKDIVTNMTVSIYFVCRDNHLPFTLDEMSKTSGCPKRFIGKKYRTIGRAISGLRIISPRSWDYVPRFCLIIDADMDKETIKKAVKWLKQEIEKGIRNEYKHHNYPYGEWLIEELTKLLDKAFEDVTKKGEET